MVSLARDSLDLANSQHEKMLNLYTVNMATSIQHRAMMQGLRPVMRIRM